MQGALLCGSAFPQSPPSESSIVSLSLSTSISTTSTGECLKEFPAEAFEEFLARALLVLLEAAEAPPSPEENMALSHVLPWSFCSCAQQQLLSYTLQ
mmetsp:Transcript_96176/g.210462  ORF Transcript_96176/g.210462 Transcript_96176/m.210462 type:complete len:97 (+) Transcript_96176:806-1096(+)